MNQKEMVKELAERLDTTQVFVKDALKELIGIIRGEIQATGRIQVADLGVFTLRTRKAGKSKSWGLEFSYPERKTVHFIPSVNFKKAINLK